MKKLIPLFLILVFILNSCSSLSNGSSSNYSAHVYSSTYSINPIDINGKVLVVCDTSDPMLQIAVESNIVKAFEEKGITAFSYADSSIMALPESPDELYGTATANDCRYVFVIGFNDFYTYEYGGGISQLYFDSNALDLYSAEIAIKVTGAIAADENQFDSYLDTLEPACACLGEAIAEEYMKYVNAVPAAI